MLEGFQSLNLFPITGGEIFIRLFIALICGLIVSWIYRRSYRGPNYSVTLSNSIVALAMITAVVILLIGNNLARAFGLVGAMSIIRFRTAIKDTQEIVFIFFALAVGMASGVGMPALAFIGTFFIGAVLFVMYKSDHGVTRKQEYLLQFIYHPDGENEPPYVPIIEKYCRRHKLINVKSLQDGQLLEVSFYINLRSMDQSADFLRDFSKLDSVDQVNLYFDEEQI